MHLLLLKGGTAPGRTLIAHRLRFLTSLVVCADMKHRTGSVKSNKCQLLICSLGFPFADTCVNRWQEECLGCRTLHILDLYIESAWFQTRYGTPWFQTGEQTFPA